MADLWQACIAPDPGMRPSAANVQAALRRLQAVPRPAAAQAAADPPFAESAGTGDGEQPGIVPEAGAGAPGVAAAEQPATGQHAGVCCREGRAAAVGAAWSRAPEPASREPGAYGGVTQSGEAKRQDANRACTHSFASPLDVPLSV